MELIKQANMFENHLEHATNTSGGYKNRTALMVAANYGQLEVVQYLVSMEADVNAVDEVKSVNI
jgi:ankyrin repeat protein